MRPDAREPKDFPTLVVRVIEALGHANRRRIIGELQNASSMTYTELKDAVAIGKGTLNHHLTILLKAGIVRNSTEVGPSGDVHSFYEVAPLGRKAVDAVFSVFGPPDLPKVFSNAEQTVEDYELRPMENWMKVVSADRFDAYSDMANIPREPEAIVRPEK